MLIVDQKTKIKPLVDLINYNFLLEELIEAVESYISEHSRRAYIKGREEQVFYISGMANKHHNRLSRYLNSHFLNKHKLKSIVVTGEFANYPAKHVWLDINGVIIDLTLSQFKDKRLDTYDKFRELIDTHCFISDNPENIIYRLYKKDATR